METKKHNKSLFFVLAGIFLISSQLISLLNHISGYGFNIYVIISALFYTAFGIVLLTKKNNAATAVFLGIIFLFDTIRVIANITYIVRTEALSDIFNLVSWIAPVVFFGLLTLISILLNAREENTAKKLCPVSLVFVIISLFSLVAMRLTLQLTWYFATGTLAITADIIISLLCSVLSHLAYIFLTLAFNDCQAPEKAQTNANSGDDTIV